MGSHSHPDRHHLRPRPAGRRNPSREETGWRLAVGPGPRSCCWCRPRDQRGCLTIRWKRGWPRCCSVLPPHRGCLSRGAAGRLANAPRSAGPVANRAEYEGWAPQSGTKHQLLELCVGSKMGVGCLAKREMGAWNGNPAIGGWYWAMGVPNCRLPHIMPHRTHRFGRAQGRPPDCPERWQLGSKVGRVVD